MVGRGSRNFKMGFAAGADPSFSQLPSPVEVMDLDAARCVDVNHRPIGNPKRKV
jgi:hypothetical protein